MNGGPHAVAGKRGRGGDGADDAGGDRPAKRAATDSVEGVTLRLPLCADSAPIVEDPIIMRLPLADTPVPPRAGVD
jgi:hypothetical protein